MDVDPVPAFAALAHPQRLAVLRMLLRHHPYPIPAGEIAARLDLRASTLSGYLSQMREAGLITQNRRGTSLLYGVALDGLTGLNTAWLGGVCGGRGWPLAAAPEQRVRNLLILGRGNAGPTLAAEAILRRRAGAVWEVFSGGVVPADAPDPALLSALAGAGYDTDALFTKPLSLVTGPDAPPPDAVLVLGETALKAEPDWPGTPVRAHWRLPARLSAPSLVEALETRLQAFAALDPASAAAPALLAALDAAAV